MNLRPPVSPRVGNVKNSDFEPDRTGRGGVNLRMWLAAVFVIVAVGGCV